MTWAQISKPRPRLRSTASRNDVVVVAAVHPVERAVVHGLHAVLDREVGAAGQLLQQVEHVVGHAVAARADGEADDLRVRERFLVERSQRSTGA